ncbi:MAG: WD40 repeat domain-containing protein, partial [Methylococcaceae bacterium]|nr:WD40 repeat domain-containing protein [Methylococcaceae bacterium]
LKGGAAEQVYEGAGYPLQTLAVSPDGQTLAAAGEQGTLVIVEVATGKLLQRLVGHATAGSSQENSVRSIAYTPNGTQLISAGDDKKIIVWQQDAQHQFSQLTAWQAPDKVRAIAISPDGLTLASGGVDNNISLWELKTGKLKTTLKKHSQTIAERGLSFNATGELLASASYDGTAIIWQVSTGQPRQVLQGHTGKVFAVAFSPDSQTVLTGSEDKSLRLWSVATGEALGVLNGHNNNVYAAQFLGKGDYLLSGGFDHTLRFWDTRSGVSLRLWQGHTSGINQLATYANQLFSASNDGTVRRWDLDLPYQQNLVLPNEPRSAAISPDLSTVAVGFANGGLSLYNPDTGLAVVQHATAHKDKVQRLAFNRTGDLLASGSFDYTAKIWRLKAGTAAKPAWGLQEQTTLTRHSAAIHGLAFAPDSLSLATASYDGQIGLYNLSQPNQPQFFKAHDGNVASVVFNNSGTQLLSSGIDDRISKWWAITTQPATLLSELPKAKEEVMWVSLSPDQQQISQVGRGFASLFNTQTQQSLALVGHENTVFKSLFSPDSRTLATVSSDATVKFWTTDVGSELFSLRLPTNAGYPTPLWDFDFRCLNVCLVAVPLTAGRLLLYQFAYQEPLAFNHDLNEQKRTRLVLWQDYLAKTSTLLLQKNALAAAQQAYREAETLGQPLLKQYPDDVQIQQAALQSYQLQAKLQ